MVLTRCRIGHYRMSRSSTEIRDEWESLGNDTPEEVMRIELWPIQFVNYNVSLTFGMGMS